jgi:glucose-1-phosphate cytidylyltransferase
MKVVILAGGLGTRFSEETFDRPKPMIEIGGMPILWHIMKIYSAYGFNEFIICCGYKGYVIKEFFANYSLHQSDITFDFKKNSMEVHNERSEDWRVTLVDTGAETMTGGRLLAASDFLSADEPFCFTYGDGLINVDVGKLVAYHKSHGKKATLCSVLPPGRFGSIELKKGTDTVSRFVEKPRGDGAMINGGFFVLSPAVLALLTGPDCIWEEFPLQKLAHEGELKVFRHEGFWQPMDTLRDKMSLTALWNTENAPWKVW